MPVGVNRMAHLLKASSTDSGLVFHPLRGVLKAAEGECGGICELRHGCSHNEDTIDGWL